MFPATTELVRLTYVTRIVEIVNATKEEHGDAFDYRLKVRDANVAATERERIIAAIVKGSARDIVARNGGDTSHIDAIINLIESQA
jgi:hypothetical protein